MNISLNPEQIRPSISKCVTNTESELNNKHVRLLLLHTHHPDHYVIIWENFIILSRIKVNSVAAFKFCNLLHRLLRDGSPQFLVHSERCLFVLKDFEKDWMSYVATGQLDTQGYLLCSVKYCHYIMDKIAFHAQYKHVSGNISIQNMDMVCMLDKRRKDGSDFSSVQFTAFILKQLEGIIDVQNLIFANINVSTAKPETVSCRILALIPLIEDAKKLYFIAVQSLHYLFLHTTYGIVQQFETSLIKLFPGIRKFFMRCKDTSALEGKVWIPQIPNIPPKFSKTAEPSRTLLHSISEQPTSSVASKPILKRNVSSRIAALQKTVVVPRNKIDIENKPLPPIPRPNSSTSNNRPVYEDDENIYEELSPIKPDPNDDEYFTDSDFDSTDDEDDEDNAEAAKYKFNQYYESGDSTDGKDDPRAMLQRVLLLGVQKEDKTLPVKNDHNEVQRTNNVIKRPEVQPIQEETYDIPVSPPVTPLKPVTFQSSNSSHINVSYKDRNDEPGIEVIDVADLMSQIKALKQKVENLRRSNDSLINQNDLLREENERLKNNNTVKSPKLQSSSTFYVNGSNNSQTAYMEPKSSESASSFANENGQRRNLRESVRFFETFHN